MSFLKKLTTAMLLAVMLTLTAALIMTPAQVDAGSVPAIKLPCAAGPPIFKWSHKHIHQHHFCGPVDAQPPPPPPPPPTEPPTEMPTTGPPTTTTTMATTTTPKPDSWKTDGLLMIVGGLPNPLKVQMIDIGGNGLACPQLADSPLDWGAVGRFFNRKPLVCASSNARDKCFIHDNATDTWSPAPGGSLHHSLTERGAVELENGTWWLAAGGNSIKTEIVKQQPAGDLTSVPSVDLPRGTYWPVILRDDKKVYFVGGYLPSSNDVWVWDMDTTSSLQTKWKQLPNMPKARNAPQAGLVTYPDGSRKLVVAGGSGDRTIAIFDLGESTWQQAASDLPNDISHASSVQGEKTFLMVGGYSGQLKDYLTTIYEFDPRTETFLKKNVAMRYKNRLTAAFIIPKDYVPCF